MIDSSENDGRRRPGTRPFVSGRDIARAEPTTSAYAPSRPFPFAGARTSTGSASRTTALVPIANAGMAPTPRWSVAVYEPGLEHVAAAQDHVSTQEFMVGSPDAPRFHAASPGEVAEASLALAEDVVEAQRHSSSLAAASVLENVARRLRCGEILLLPGASTQTDAAVVSSVLAALLGGRR